MSNRTAQLQAQEWGDEDDEGARSRPKGRRPQTVLPRGRSSHGKASPHARERWRERTGLPLRLLFEAVETAVLVPRRLASQGLVNGDKTERLGAPSNRIAATASALIVLAPTKRVAVTVLPLTEDGLGTVLTWLLTKQWIEEAV